MTDNSDYDSLNMTLKTHSRQGTKKTFEILPQKQNDQFSEEAPYSDKDPNETISESEEVEESNNEESHIPNTNDSGKQKDLKEKTEQGRWTPNEHHLFLEGLIKYGNEWKMVQKHIKSRSSTQARSHAQKFFIRIKKQISTERNPDFIKRKIHQIFRDEMQDKFKPDNLGLFLDKIMKLVFVSEMGNRRNSLLIEAKDDLNNEESSSSNDSSSNKLTIKIEDQNNLLKLNDLKMSFKRRKESFFSIEKDLEKINIRKMKPKVEKKPEMPKSFYENYTQTIQQKGTPSCINIVNITMVNNSTNTYVQNYNNPTTEEPSRNWTTRNESNTNPFNLQFDELLFKSSNGNYGHDRFDMMNFQDDEHFFDNDDF